MSSTYSVAKEVSDIAAALIVDHYPGIARHAGGVDILYRFEPDPAEERR